MLPNLHERSSSKSDGESDMMTCLQCGTVLKLSSAAAASAFDLRCGALQSAKAT